MASVEALHIDLEASANAAKPLEISLGNEFFQSLDQHEISGGDISVTLNIRKTSGGFFSLHYTVRGGVDVECDRCLDTLTLEVDAADDVKVFYEEPASAYDAEDIKMLPPRTNVYDIAWDIYEIAELSLPLRRVHDSGLCNPEMLGRLENLSTIPEETN